MAVSKWKKLKENIIILLESKGNYEGTDDNLIDILIFNLQECDKSMKDIRKTGQKVNVRRSGEEPYYQLNLSIAAHNQFSKNANTIYSSLGITPRERKKLNMLAESGGDNLFDILGEKE
jgi:hypothetical protein